MGRAARHSEGRVIMYGNRITDAMRYAVEETRRRRKKQTVYNKKYNIKPKTIKTKPYESMI
jgi:excinuclease ABC subunit B